MNNKTTKRLVGNTVMLYLMTIAKIVIPLISLPYLTRVLSVDCYGSVSFVKSLVAYLQILIDFGFLLSATKEIIRSNQINGNADEAISNAFYAQTMLAFLAQIIMVICAFTFPILKGLELFAILSAVAAGLSILWFEYIFKAYEKMGKIAIRVIVVKSVALVLTLLFVKSDKDIILMPIFDIIASLIATIFVFIELKKLNVKVRLNFKNIKGALKSLGNSFVYFISNFATTAFGALNTLLIGAFLLKSDVAFWSLAMQLVTAIQSFYSPIINSVHPVMLKEKNLNYIHKILMIYMPIILIGCAIIIFAGDWIVSFAFTDKYLTSAALLKYMIPVLIFSFPGMLYGWPTLDAIDKTKQTTFTTILSAIVQVVGLCFLALIGQFNLIGLAIARNVSEITLCASRMIVCYKNKALFIKPSVVLEENKIEG